MTAAFTRVVSVMDRPSAWDQAHLEDGVTLARMRFRLFGCHRLKQGASVLGDVHA